MLVKAIIFLLFNEHLQSISRVGGGRNKNKNKMWKLTFFGYHVTNNDQLCC